MESIRALKDVWDRALAVVLTLAGAVLLVLGWFGISGQGLTSLQIPYVVSGGLGGIFLMGVGAALWLSADLRDEWHKLDRIEAVLESGLERLGLGRDGDGGPTLAPLSPPPGFSSAGLADPTVVPEIESEVGESAAGPSRPDRPSRVSTTVNGTSGWGSGV
jgi:hypothetical protein